MHPQPKSTPKVDPRVDHKAKPEVEQVGSSPSAIMENTIFFFLSRRGGRVAKFQFATPTLSCFFLLTGQRSNSGIITGQDGQAEPGRGQGRAGPGRNEPEPRHHIYIYVYIYIYIYIYI